MGGCSGHICHLVDDPDITFGDLRDVISSASAGTLENVSEKFDGQNLNFTYNLLERELKAARNQGDVKGGGMSAEELAEKFEGRGTVFDAFTIAFDVLGDAVAQLEDEDLAEIFGEDGNFWYPFEIIYPENSNVINYDIPAIIFHGSPILSVSPETGKIEKAALTAGYKHLTDVVEKMKVIEQTRHWKIGAQFIIKLRELLDSTPGDAVIAKLNSMQSSFGLSDDSTLNEYIERYLDSSGYFDGLSPDVKAATIARMMKKPGAPTLTKIKKMATDTGEYELARSAVNESKEIIKEAKYELDMLIHQFAIEVLRGVGSVLVTDSSKESNRLRREVKSAISAIEASGSEEALEIVQSQIEKLELDKVAPLEGVVFIWRGKSYKFTGNFAPVNQILGLFKYGRGKIGPFEKPANESILRRVTSKILEFLKRF